MIQKEDRICYKMVAILDFAFKVKPIAHNLTANFELALIKTDKIET